jgi:acyl-CoA synthetase (AMP-forming)/AMP-acid ligase II
MTTWLQDLASRWGSADALVEPGGRTLSFAELDRSVGLLAGGLQAQGLRRGDRIASLLPNGALAAGLFLAAARLGAVTIGVNTRYRAEDLRHVIARGRPRFLVATESFLGIDFPRIVADALAEVSLPPTVLWGSDIERLQSGPALLGDGAGSGDLLVGRASSGIRA